MTIMESENKLNEKIMTIINRIENKHPELLKYLDEMPMTIPKENNPEINIKILKEYYESLEKIEKEIEKSHVENTSHTIWPRA